MKLRKLTRFTLVNTRLSKIHFGIVPCDFFFNAFGTLPVWLRLDFPTKHTENSEMHRNAMDEYLELWVYLQTCDGARQMTSYDLDTNDLATCVYWLRRFSTIHDQFHVNKSVTQRFDSNHISGIWVLTSIALLWTTLRFQIVSNSSAAFTCDTEDRLKLFRANLNLSSRQSQLHTISHHNYSQVSGIHKVSVRMCSVAWCVVAWVLTATVYRSHFHRAADKIWFFIVRFGTIQPE